jgi:DEAD/DEAH box helicase domain-containing protein
VWTSAGVTLNWQRPTESGGSDHIQSIRWAWNCRECGEAGCEGVMSQTCLACDSPALEQTQFLEPAGFRVEWRCKPHADTDTVDYIEPQPVRISAREARWEPLLDPVLGRGRATADGLVFHHSMGANRQGYRICLECGRAAEEGTGDLRDHQALMPSKGGGGRCSGNDKTYAITRPVALGHEVLTDVAEFQPAALGSAGAAWALAAALREALSRRLGIEARELGLAVERRVGTLGEATHSIFLFDQSAGGAGYAPRLLDEIAGVLRDAAEVLNCPAECVKGCSSCVLVADLFAQQEVIDRCAALEFVKALQNEMIDPRADDIAGPGCRLSRPAADAIARRVRPGEVVAIWVHDELDMGALAQPPISTLFDVLARVGADVRLVLTERLTVQLDDSSRAGLRNASHRHGFTLWAGKPITAGNGAVLLATLAKGEETTAFLSRDPTAAMLGIGWGSGLDYPIVEMPFAGVAMEHIPDEAMERTAKTGDRVRIIASDAGRPIRLFGTGLVNNVLRGELEAAGLWRPGRLSALSYSDRYLKSPLAVLLMLRTAAALRTALAPSEAVIPLAIKTEPLRLDRHAGPPLRLCHDWSAENERASTIQDLVVGFGFAPSYDSSHASHGRKLTIRYDDGVEAAILFDQGFGYWRANSGDRHDFRVAPRLQAKAMLDSSAFVAGHGESYIAIVRILT